MALNNKHRRVFRKTERNLLQDLGRFVLIGLAGLSLAGCASSMSGGLPSATPSLAPSSAPALATPAAAPATLPEQALQPAKTVSLAMTPIIGPPPQSGISNRLAAKLKTALARRNVKIVKGKASLKLRGILSSTTSGEGTELAYLWDVNNKGGRRQHRIAGDKRVSGGSKNNPWSSVSDKVLTGVANDTADRLAGWLAAKSGGTAMASRPAPSKKRVRARTGARTKTASRKPSKAVIMAMVMPVSGAPGDGKASLTKAIKNKLYGKGVRLTSQRADGVYQVRGVVQVGKSKGSTQPIQIDWRVYDPKGKRLGTVTQKNNIPPGSLNGAWGPIADAAAGAAADGITKLLPKTTRL